jgi:DNA-binding LacI/PurR family transcriptional regulator
VHQDFTALGRRNLEHLLDRLDGRRDIAAPGLVDAQLVVRASVAVPQLTPPLSSS